MNNISAGRLASMQELVIGRALWPLSRVLILSLILVIGAIKCAQLHNNQSVTSSRPYWHRAGCHQVGHTRTISIPGCVKFNLSTNACRGFCVSFSIPATDDIGPPQAPTAAAAQAAHSDGVTASAGRLSSTTPTTVPPTSEITGAMQTQQHQHQLASIISGQGNNGQPIIITRRLARQYEEDRKPSARGVAQQSALSGARQQKMSDIQLSDLKMSDFVHLIDRTKSPLAGAVGDLSERRDVISVGQCCNMMETEDVTINLRCGLNETRKLVFKSAKTCECFFCKHI